MGGEWSKPGFGWTSSRSVVEVISGPELQVSRGTIVLDVAHSLNEKSTAKALLNAEQMKWFEQRLQEAMSRLKPHEIEELQTTAKSNKRILKWDIMVIPKNTKFSLHAHPNIELIYIVSGTMHEYRYVPADMDHDVTTVDFPESGGKLHGPSMTSVLHHQFKHTSVHTNEVIVNSIGSIHLSYTKEDGATLIVLWGGSHANIPLQDYPPDFHLHTTF